MTDLQSALLAEMEEEHACLRGDDVVRFDGSPAWTTLTSMLAEGAVAMAERMRRTGDVEPTGLVDHFGTSKE